MSDIKTVFIRLFGISPQLRLIDFFMDNPNHDFTNREIMEAVRMAKTTLYRYLPRLLEADIIRISRKIGRAHFYMLNSGSPTTKFLIGLEAELMKPAGPTKVCGGCGKIVIMETTLTRGGYMVETCPKCGYRIEEPDEDE